MGYTKEIAGIFAGLGGIMALYLGEVVLATALLTGILAFFVGDLNGQRKVAQNSG